MKILSEKTNKEYASVEECLAAEKEFDRMIAEKKAAAEKALAERKAKQEAVANERKAAAEKIEVARQAMVEATKHYRELMSEFCQKFGSYHRTYRFDNKDALNFLDDFFNIWF